MKSKAFYKFLNILKDKNNNDNTIEFFEEFTINEILFAFKCNGVGVNAYPGSKSNNFFLELSPLLISKASNQIEKNSIKEYEMEINTWNKLFNDFYLKDDFKKVTAISDEKKLYSFLIAFEVYVRALNDIKFNNRKNGDYYGEVELQKKIDGEIRGIDELSANQYTNAIEYIFHQASKVVQAFIFHGYLFEKSKFQCCSCEDDIEWDNINQSMLYFPLIDIRTILFDSFEEWKFADYKVLQKDNINIEIKPINIKGLINEKIAIQRFETSRISMVSKKNSIDIKSEKGMNCFTYDLAPINFFDKYEELSYSEYLEYFSSSNLNYKVNGVEIPKWLRAYAIIRHVNKEFMNSNTFPDLTKPEKWLVITTVDVWIDKFVAYGIDSESAKIICTSLIFNKNSIDWFDTPFIQIGEKIITVPSYACLIQDSLSLISLATKADFNLDFKGYCFEDRILSDLNVNGIQAISIKRKVGKEEYQCDVAFILGKDLFLCECKHTSQPTTQRKKYDFYNRKIPEDIEQINRIAAFYSSNVQLIIKKINSERQCEFEENWKPRYVYKMIIYSCKVISGTKNTDVIITDYTIFTTLLYKRLPTIFENGKPARQFMPPNMKGAYQGELTANKLLNYIQNPWQIGYQKAFTRVEDETVPINKMNLIRKKVFRTTDDFYSIK